MCVCVCVVPITLHTCYSGVEKVAGIRTDSGTRESVELHPMYNIQTPIQEYIHTYISERDDFLSFSQSHGQCHTQIQRDMRVFQQR